MHLIDRTDLLKLVF